MELNKAKELYSRLVVDAWYSGDLRYKLKRCQRAMLDAISTSSRFKYIIKCARRLGKSYLLVAIAVMFCRRKAYAQVRYAAPTAKSLKNIIHPIMRKITEDMPAELRPEWKAADGKYVFPGTNAELYLAGVNNNHADDLRGTACDLFIIDEAGTVDDLHYLVHDVALPQLLDPDGHVVAGRRLIMASSPPRTPAHEFTQMANEAEVGEYYSHYNIFEGEYPNEVLSMFLREDGISEADLEALLSGDLLNIKSTTVKREYLALDVVDEKSALCPEWDNREGEAFEVDEYFQFYQKYNSLDVGVRHFSVSLAGHYDFLQAKLFMHDEVARSGPEMTTDLMAQDIRRMEEQRFGVKWEMVDGDGARKKWKMVPPDNNFKLRRVSDINLLLIQDLARMEGLFFDPTDKGELEQMVNQVRVWVAAGRIVVHPRCKQLLGCLKYGIWNKRRTDFDVSLAYGHFDAFAALMYLVRNVDDRTNPIPPTYKKPIDDWFYPDPVAGKREKLKKMFNVR